MANIQAVIKKLQQLEQEYGNIELKIYHSFNKETKTIDESQIYYDEEMNDIYIGIYN